MVKVFRYLSILVVATHKKAVLKYFTKFTEKHLCRSLFLITMQALVRNFIMKRYAPKKAV